jgi:hypothetical protein
LKQVKDNPEALPAVFDAGWESLSRAHRLMASIPREAIDDAVLTKQLALQRYATALLVRLRRLKRGESSGAAATDGDDEFGGDDGED